MRLFISIQVPPHVIEEIVRIQKILTSQNLFVGTLIKPEQLHSTLLFLGNVEVEQLPEIIQKLETIRYTEFTASLNSLKANSWKYPHVLWLTLCSPALHELARIIHVCLDYKEEHAFRAHITLFRIKKIFDKQKLQELLQNSSVQQKTWIVTKFTLQQSELHSEGARYTCLHVFYLEN